MIIMVLRYIKRHIMLKKDFIDAIKTRRKKATVRLGKVKVDSREVFIHAGGQIVAKAIVKSIRYKKVKELNDEDAKLDGLNSRDELLKVLKRLYGNISDEDIVTIIEFDVIQFMNVVEGYLWKELPPYQLAELALKHLDLSDNERKILETIIKTRSIRRASKLHFGTLRHRYKIRKLLKRCMKELKERKIIAGD